MSNTAAVRVNHKPCTFDGSTDRDSNGQCHCRNILYRISAKQTDEVRATLAKAFNAALKKGTSIEDARDAARAKAGIVKAVPEKKAAPAKKAAAKKTAAKKTAAASKKASKKAPSVAPVDPAVDADPTVTEDAPEATEEPSEAEVDAPEDVLDDLLGDDFVPVDEDDDNGFPDDEAQAHEAVWDDTGWHCACGFVGKGTGPSIRAHVSAEMKKANASA